MRLEILAAIAIIACYLIGASMAFEDEVAEQEMYCDMVESGAWPAYRGECDE